MLTITKAKTKHALQHNGASPKGFTLIELLIVIGILAILATVVVLVLNPVELFSQTRDSRRVEDLSSITKSINLYLTTIATPDLSATGANCIGEATPRFWGTVAGLTSNFTGATTQHANVATTVNGTGWVPVDFTTIPSGSPLTMLPTDPINPDTTTYNYQYTCNQATGAFEINANLESQRYTSGSENLENSDGGNSATLYETGNDQNLDL